AWPLALQPRRSPLSKSSVVSCGASAAGGLSSFGLGAGLGAGFGGTGRDSLGRGFGSEPCGSSWGGCLVSSFCGSHCRNTCKPLLLALISSQRPAPSRSPTVSCTPTPESASTRCGT